MTVPRSKGKHRNENANKGVRSFANKGVRSFA